MQSETNDIQGRIEQINYQIWLIEQSDNFAYVSKRIAALEKERKQLMKQKNTGARDF